VFHQPLEQRGHANSIHVGVAADLVHALTDTNHCGQVKNDIRLAQQRPQRIQISDITDHETVAWVEVCRPPDSFAVDLGLQVVQQNDVVPGACQGIGEV
jgi:hypothetical protein